MPPRRRAFPARLPTKTYRQNISAHIRMKYAPRHGFFGSGFGIATHSNFCRSNIPILFVELRAVLYASSTAACSSVLQWQGTASESLPCVPVACRTHFSFALAGVGFFRILTLLSAGNDRVVCGACANLAREGKASTIAYFFHCFKCILF